MLQGKVSVWIEGGDSPGLQGQLAVQLKRISHYLLFYRKKQTNTPPRHCHGQRGQEKEFILLSPVNSYTACSPYTSRKGSAFLNSGTKWHRRVLFTPLLRLSRPKRVSKPNCLAKAAGKRRCQHANEAFTKSANKLTARVSNLPNNYYAS